MVRWLRLLMPAHTEETQREEEIVSGCFKCFVKGALDISPVKRLKYLVVLYTSDGMMVWSTD